MCRKVLYAAIYWLALTETLVEAEKTVKSSIVKDNASAESAPRLYRNVPVGVYASASPYAAFSFQVPAYITAPKPAASRIVPVKEQLVLHNTNGYLRDSYGNKFVGAPQAAAYKTSFPQQFVPLQGLPAHLSQPLLAASPQVKQSSPHYFLGSHYRYPSFQVAGPTYGSNQGSFSSPYVHAEHFRNFVPVSTSPLQGGASAQQQASNNAVNPGVTTIEQFKNYNGPKFQRYEYKTEGNYKNEANNGAPTDDKSQIQAAAAKTAVTAIVNGKKTVINVDTDPVPLLDLSLLEPLRFENPLVPQVQHFLPRINEETYRALHEINSDQEQPPKKEFVQKTKIYDSGIVKDKSRKEIQKKTPKYPVQHDSNRQIPVQPTITVKETPNLGPEIIYEINEPNYKETYKEQSVSYNKETQSEPVHINYDSKNEAEPVHYSYNKVVKKEPVTYSFVHSKKTPLEITHAPRQLIYSFQNGDSNKNNAQTEDANSSEDTGSGEHNGSSEDSSSVEDTHDDEPATHRNHEEYHKSAPNSQNQGDKLEHREQEYHYRPSEQTHHRPAEQSHHRPIQQSHHRHSEQSQHRPPEQSHHRHSEPSHHRHSEQSHHRHSEQSQRRPPEQNHHRHSEQSHHRPSEQTHHRSSEQTHHRPSEQSHQRSNEEHRRPNNQYHHHPHQKDYIRRPSEEHADSHRQHHYEHNEEHQHRPKEEYQHKQHLESHEGPASKEVYHQKPVENDHHNNPNQEVSHVQSQPIDLPIKQAQPQYQEFIPLQYEEDIRQEEPVQHAEIRVDPVQHLQPPSPLPETVDGDNFSQKQKSIVPFGAGTPIIHEKAKTIIIQEESPEEKHMHQEQIMAEVFDQENNNEEDFENGYKNAAIGFEAFEKKAKDIERDIYDPSAYGKAPKGFDLEKTPFHQYHADGETFPKSSRLRYRDDRDNLKEDYYLMYSANRPDSLSDRYKNKANYYKLYKENKPEKYFAASQDKKKAKYTSPPTYDFFEPTPKKKTNKYFAQYKSEPIKYEYDYSKENPRDNSAHASHPYQRLKSRTHFVEPQFQYGFEPVALPRLLDSELAAMASNDSPESEKPGMRKKIYHENWYIKKTSTTGGAPS